MVRFVTCVKYKQLQLNRKLALCVIREIFSSQRENTYFFLKKFKTITPGHRKIKVYGIEKNQHG